MKELSPSVPQPPRQKPLSERLGFLTLRASFIAGSALLPHRTADRALRYFMLPQRLPRPGWEKEIVKTARRSVMDSGLVAYSWGRGPRVLIVHGWDGRGTQMARIATAIADAGFEAVAIDLPGHGESPGNFAHIPMAKDALLRVGQTLGPLHAIIGHSFGAGAALYAVEQGLATNRIVYLAGPSRFVDLFDRYCAWIGLGGRARRIFDEKLKALVGTDPTVSYPAEWAKRVRTPALIVHDREDEDCPFPEGEEMHRNWPASQFLVTSGLGHRRLLKSKEVLAAVVDFVRT